MNAVKKPISIYGKHNMNVYITPVSKRLESYERFYKGALSAIDQIASRHGNWDNSEYASTVMCEPLFAVIGTGYELQDFKMLRLEVQTPMKQYADPSEEANYNFTFKPVNRNSSVNFS